MAPSGRTDPLESSDRQPDPFVSRVPAGRENQSAFGIIAGREEPLEQAGAEDHEVLFESERGYEVEPFDPLVLASVSALLPAVALAAVLAPARRATRIQPASTLRGEA